MVVKIFQKERLMKIVTTTWVPLEGQSSIFEHLVWLNDSQMKSIQKVSKKYKKILKQYPKNTPKIPKKMPQKWPQNVPNYSDSF